MNRIEDLTKGTKFFKKNENNIFKGFLISRPYMTKYDIQNFQEELTSSEYNSTIQNQLLKIRTSGSTGKIVEVLWNKEDYIISNLCLWRLRKKYYNIKNSDYYLTFHSTIYSGTQARDNDELEIINRNTYLSINKFSFSSNSFEKYSELIKVSPIKWIFTQPSMLLILMKTMQENNIKPQELFPHLRYIELNGEILFESEREIFSDFFNVSIANLYGASEVNGIAYQCPNGHLHVVDSNVSIQLFNYRKLGNNIYEGDIAVTSLHNSVMPIVAYALGDRIKVSTEESCSYSSAPTINVLIGRSSDSIHLSEAITISSYQFSYWVERVNTEVGNPILEYKIKNSAKKTIVYLYIKKDFYGWENEITRRLDKKITDIYDGCNIEYVCLEQPIELSDNGKVRSIEYDE